MRQHALALDRAYAVALALVLHGFGYAFAVLVLMLDGMLRPAGAQNRCVGGF